MLTAIFITLSVVIAAIIARAIFVYWQYRKYRKSLFENHARLAKQDEGFASYFMENRPRNFAEYQEQLELFDKFNKWKSETDERAVHIFNKYGLRAAINFLSSLPRNFDRWQKLIAKPQRRGALFGNR